MESRQDAPCPICKAETFVWGQMRAQGLVFLEEDSPWLKKTFARGTSMTARRCKLCGNVQLFSEEAL